jgi:2-polyprenyl-3-methyl-5-hydroxy-6-metoxy-1,4-benzoquinol methylase
MQFVNPRPTFEEISKYYEAQYFTNRTDRGYKNYFSKSLQIEIERVIELNLKDLNFFKYEKQLKKSKKSLDIGCAAGYFVNYLKKRDWTSYGIDVSEKCIEFAQKNLHLNVKYDNYLNYEYQENFDLITLWATIEHLHYPTKTIKKIFNDLNPGGYIYLSTCRTGGLNFMQIFGSKWRYYNFPEHLFFFSLKNIKNLLKKEGFIIKKSFTYGSGFGKPKTTLRKFSDFLAKYLSMGDMMVISAQKPINKIKK